MSSAIYLIVNKTNYKKYVGSSVDYKQRFRQHKRYLNLNKHQNRFLQRAWNKYGEDNFEFKIIELCEKEKLIEREQFWLDWLQLSNVNYGYNLRILVNSNIGVKHSKEYGGMIRLRLIGRKLSEETKRKMSLASKGKSKSDIAKLNMSIAKKVKNRELLKWPHELADKCKCKECKDKKNEYFRNYYRMNHSQYTIITNGVI